MAQRNSYHPSGFRRYLPPVFARIRVKIGIHPLCLNAVASHDGTLCSGFILFQHVQAANI